MSSTQSPAVVKRSPRPLEPRVEVLFVDGGELRTFQPNAITPDSVGQKAYGLATLPSNWTLPFFVISGRSRPEPGAVAEAMERTGIDAPFKVIVRSSGVDESMEERGSLDSIECEINDVVSALLSLESRLQNRLAATGNCVHWVVQQLVPVSAKGHLSNESRVAEDKRDWLAEAEASPGKAHEARPISLRPWRDSRPPHEDPLTCRFREQYVKCLGAVARWAYDRLIRVHFEWVWDGNRIHIVQADECSDLTGGVDPKKLVVAPPKGKHGLPPLKIFRLATTSDFLDFRKLGNAQLYRQLGYSMVPFYVLDDPGELNTIVNDGTCSEDLLHDLQILTSRPLVIRSDGREVPEELRQMLPRSEELRTFSEARDWLVTVFRIEASKQTNDGASLATSRPALIAHHFLPATASAWCQARPNQRRVRIESLWGLPEGLYWHAYDAYDVDTLASTTDISRPARMVVRERRRYKERFVAPDASGKWILHQTISGPDWQRSIKRTEWIEEIAWTSRQIADKTQLPVVVMWFVDIPQSASSHRVLPWYHEKWNSDASLQKAAPRHKLSVSADFELLRRADWLELQQRVNAGEHIVRARVHPIEPDIVRDREFAEQLAAFAKEHNIVVELEGGVLSHAYYMLSRAGCIVECADLDDYATDDYELEFNKLVRDNIPQSIADRGEAVTSLRLEGAALISALKKKVVEESLEVLDATTTDEMAEEIADVREVISSLMKQLDIADADVEQRRRKKAKKRGGFDEGLMLSKTAVASPLMTSPASDDFPVELTQVIGTISREAEIPRSQSDMHVDKRVDGSGAMERQFTVDVPSHASGYAPERVLFNLETQTGEPHEMVLELVLTRRGGDLRIRIRLRNAAVQLSLPLEPPTRE